MLWVWLHCFHSKKIKGSKLPGWGSSSARPPPRPLAVLPIAVRVGAENAVRPIAVPAGVEPVARPMIVPAAEAPAARPIAVLAGVGSVVLPMTAQVNELFGGFVVNVSEKLRSFTFSILPKLN